MIKPTIWGHCLVKNEERWVWYAIMSAINYLDRLLIYDTGSTDKTGEVIRTIRSPKIEFKKYGPVGKEEFHKVRQEMLEKTKADWIFILDGDEIWRNNDIELVIKAIRENGDDIESIVVKTINFIGDIYHYQEEAAGQYEIAGRRGHLNLRAINMDIPGLHAAGAYGEEGYFDIDNKPIQNRDPEKILFLPVSYFHTTHLSRSSKDKEALDRLKKRKYEIGVSIPKNIKYPEVFSAPRPEIVPDPWPKMNKLEWLRAVIQTPLKKIKRKLIL